MIAEILGSDHTDLDRLLAEVFDLIAAEDCSEAFARLDLFWARLAIHVRAEHLHLFPAILNAFDNKRIPDRIDPGEVTQTIEHLRGDHNYFMRTLSADIKLLRVLGPTAASGREVLEGVSASLSELRDRLSEHNSIEESRIYGLQKWFCEPSERSSLARSIRHELENLPPRFGRS